MTPTKYSLLLATALVLSTADDTAQPTKAFFAAAVASSKQLLSLLECKDEADGCVSWAAGGECANNPGFMGAACRKSCNKCQVSGELAS